MVAEDYVSFETAKLLKEKGFDESISMVYMPYGDLCKSDRYDSIRNSNYNDITKNYFECTAPTQQMAVKWLREVHNIVIVIDVCRETGREGFYCWQLEDSRTGDWIVNIIGECPTYEQACDGALKYCLENLI
jgi:hypothetical protein